MLSYELCRKLEKAGFDSYNDGVFISENGGDSVYQPTLSELIEACHKYWADDFELKARDGKDWQANLRYVGGDSKWPAFTEVEGMVDINVTVAGDTPEGAVANLYIALHS